MSLFAAPPTGIVTFLFTDIEGSTRLWEQHPEAMGPALIRHDALLRQSIEDNHGFVFKTVGDAFCAAFADAADALQAALTAQAAIGTETWETKTPILVRMALHTGTAEERAGDYFGPPLNRVARLMAAGHGGQVLVSGAAQELVRDCLPPLAFLLALGSRRLKDLGRPEMVFQLQHSSLEADFPPLRSLDNPDLPNNLPQQITSFIGREKEMAEVKSLLARTHLLTMTGAGGSGKTRLSLQTAVDLLDQYFDGVWLVELAALSDPALVPQAVADVLGVREEAGKLIQRTLVDWLRSKRLLIILDNCEHLVAACATLAADLLRNCPDVHLLASSREPLNVAGEQTYRVPSLSLPDPNQSQTVEVLSQCEAVRLFIERAKLVQSAFAVTEANAPAVAQICWCLDGIPLAIELAVARVRSLAVEQIMARLDDRFRLLTGGSRTALPRQQTLRALIDWSYDLLTDQEKTVLCRLSVFAGGWTLEAAEAVCSDEKVDNFAVLDLLTSLADKSLAVAETAADSTRYRFLETVRQYAGDRLQESGEAEAVRGRSALWFLSLAEEAEPHLLGPEQASWLARLELEHDNMRASLSWYEQRSEQASGPPRKDREGGLRLIGALWRFWLVHGHYSEGRQWSGRALARTQAGTEELEEPAGEKKRKAAAARANALNGAGNLADEQGDYAGARALYEESLTLRRQLGDQKGIASLLGNLGSVAAKQSDYAGARALFEESLTVFRRMGNLQGVAGLLSNLGIVSANQGDHAGARALYEESLAVFRQLGNPQGIAAALNNLANVVSGQGDYGAARALHEESLALQRQLGSQRGIANSLNNLGNIATEQGDYARARVLVEEGLALNRQLGNLRGIANSLGSLGKMAAGQGDYARAWDLHEESLAVFRQLGDQNGIAASLCSLGSLAVIKGDYMGARAFHEESLVIHRQLRHPLGIISSLEGMAGVAQGQSQPVRAAQLWGAAASLRQTTGSLLSAAEQEKVDQEAAFVRVALSDEAYFAAWNAGSVMTLEQALEYALTDK